MQSMNIALQYKTTRREVYDQELHRARRAGFDDVLFFNERGELTEGAISNVILELDGRWYTPPRQSGLLAGTYREHLLQGGKVTEKVMFKEDLFRAKTVYLCNAMRKQWVVKPHIA
jgi:para-aminobenzoate synthetase/4-amino-4-deoxychorismate lyase